ncbi:hypothetical protein Tco_0609518 [Tanacetum coccineum]
MCESDSDSEPLNKQTEPYLRAMLISCIRNRKNGARDRNLVPRSGTNGTDEMMSSAVNHESGIRHESKAIGVGLLEVKNQLTREEERRLCTIFERKKSLQQRAIDDEEHLLELPRYNLFEHDSYDDESYYTNEDEFEALDYEEAYLAFDREKSPKFIF